jgi:hypothetical protein
MPMSGRTSLLTYVKHAFQTYANYGLLLAVCLTAVLTRQAGWLAIGCGLELMYLYLLAANPRFQRVVDSQVGDQEQLNIAPLKARMLPLIAPDMQQRYTSLEQLTSQILGGNVVPALKRDPYFQDNQRKVATLLVSFLRIAFALTRYAQYLATNDPQKVQADIDRLEGEAMTSDERTQQVKMQNIDILKQRLDKINRAAANREYLTAQLKTIEDTLQLVVDQAVTLSDPKGAGLQVETLLQNLKDSEQISTEMDGLLDMDLGQDEITAGLPPVPQKTRQ